MLPKDQGTGAGGWGQGKGREGVEKVPTTYCDSPRRWQGLVELGVCRQLLPVPRFSSSVGAT